MIAAIGYWDDLHGVAARWRFLVHLLAGLLGHILAPVFSGVYFGQWQIHWGWFAFLSLL